MMTEGGLTAGLPTSAIKRKVRTHLNASPSGDAAAALALLVVPGARKQEVLHARWEHVDMDRCAITVPRTKSGGARTIPLSLFAAEIVRRQPARREGDCPWVFPSSVDPGKPVSDAKKAWAAAKTAAGLPPHRDPQPAALLRFGAGQLRRPAVRDRPGARAFAARDHNEVRPPRARTAGGHRVHRRPGLGSGAGQVGGTGAGGVKKVREGPHGPSLFFGNTVRNAAMAAVSRWRSRQLVLPSRRP